MSGHRPIARGYVHLHASCTAATAALCLAQLALGRAFASVSSPTNAASNWSLNDSMFWPTDSSGATTTERPVVNPHDFRYVLNNPNLCRCASGKDPDMLVWIHTAPMHFKHRMLIRETWGNSLNFRDYDLRVAFFVGDSRNAAVQAQLSLEAEKYGDIVQEDFVDSYRNMTYKAIMGLKWVHTYCSGARIILKADDDVVADIFRIVRHVRALRELEVATEWTIQGKCYKDAKVMRDGKWAVTMDEFPDSVYPQYCLGMAIIMTPDLVYPLYVESLHTRYFWVDDVYFSGILAKQVKANFHPLMTIISRGGRGPEAYLRLESDYVFIQEHDMDQFLLLWNKMATLHSRNAAQSTLPTSVVERGPARAGISWMPAGSHPGAIEVKANTDASHSDPFLSSLSP